MNMVTDVRELFDRRWVCMVVYTGRHAGSLCECNDPHTGWGCGYRWMCPPLSDREAALLGIGPLRPSEVR